MDTEPFMQLNKVIHEKGRLGIVSILAASPNLSFTEIKEMLGMTDGNVTAHMKTLKQAEYVAVTKSVSKRRPLTTYTLTDEGKKAFSEYLAHLETIIELTKSPKIEEKS